MRIDPHAEARRLLGQIDADLLPELAADPAEAIPVLFDDVTVTLRLPAAGGRCGVDGTYHPGPPPHITVADDVAPSRQRFTALHELGHHLIYNDVDLNMTTISDVDRRDEAICNEVAASILLPDALVGEVLPAGAFTAEDVARLHAARGIASRAACCVAAVRRLHHHGCVLLGRTDGTAEFAAHQLGTPWRVARGTAQGPDSLLTAAARGGHARGTTRVRFANGNVSGEVHGDAFAPGDGWVFMVAVADTHSPWEHGLRFATIEPGAPREVVECPYCDKAFTAWWTPCRHCGEVRCPACRRCGCRPRAAELLCRVCQMLKAENLFSGDDDICVDCR